MRSIEYRLDIDGLRAIAVWAVIFYHIDKSLVPAGFLGVDVFFVISGYLITLIALKDGQNFSVIGFYIRRVRRIAPALFLLLLVVTPVAWVFLTPVELSEFYKSLFSVVTVSSNYYFFRQGDYFAGASSMMPLLNTWSLSIEEQYYIIFPVLFYVAKTIGFSVFRFSLVVILLWSFYYTTTIGVNDPVKGYFFY